MTPKKTSRPTENIALARVKRLAKKLGIDQAALIKLFEDGILPDEFDQGMRSKLKRSEIFKFTLKGKENYHG